MNGPSAHRDSTPSALGSLSFASVRDDIDGRAGRFASTHRRVSVRPQRHASTDTFDRVSRGTIRVVDKDERRHHWERFFLDKTHDVIHDWTNVVRDVDGDVCDDDATSRK